MIVTTYDGKKIWYKFESARQAVNAIKRCAIIEQAVQRKNAS